MKPVRMNLNSALKLLLLHLLCSSVFALDCSTAISRLRFVGSVLGNRAKNPSMFAPELFSTETVARLELTDVELAAIANIDSALQRAFQANDAAAITATLKQAFVLHHKISTDKASIVDQQGEIIERFLRKVFTNTDDLEKAIEWLGATEANKPIPFTVEQIGAQPYRDLLGARKALADRRQQLLDALELEMARATEFEFWLHNIRTAPNHPIYKQVHARMIEAFSMSLGLNGDQWDVANVQTPYGPMPMLTVLPNPNTALGRAAIELAKRKIALIYAPDYLTVTQTEAAFSGMQFLLNHESMFRRAIDGKVVHEFDHFHVYDLLNDGRILPFHGSVTRSEIFGNDNDLYTKLFGLDEFYTYRQELRRTLVQLEKLDWQSREAQIAAAGIAWTLGDTSGMRNTVLEIGDVLNKGGFSEEGQVGKKYSTAKVQYDSLSIYAQETDLGKKSVPVLRSRTTGFEYGIYSYKMGSGKEDVIGFVKAKDWTLRFHLPVGEWTAVAKKVQTRAFGSQLKLEAGSDELSLINAIQERALKLIDNLTNQYPGFQKLEKAGKDFADAPSERGYHDLIHALRTFSQENIPWLETDI